MALKIVIEHRGSKDWIPTKDVVAMLRDIHEALHLINKNQTKMEHTLDETLALVQDQSTVDDSIVTLLTNLNAQLQDLLKGRLPAEVQAKVDQLFENITANKTKIADAVTANTPQAPAPGPDNGEEATA